MSDSLHILIAYDGSPSADIALEDLHRAGLPETVEALVLSVADVWPPSSYEPAEVPGEQVPPAVKMARSQAAQAVREAQGMADRAAARISYDFPHWTVRAEAVADSPAWAIIKRAEAWPAHLVVLGAHGHSALSRFVLGSVSQKALTEVRCSVRIARAIPNRPPGDPRLAVAVDGSPGASAALRTIAQRRWPPHTQALVLAVVDPRVNVADNPFAPPPGDVLAVSEQEAHTWVDETVESAAAILTRAHLATTTLISEGDPKHAIIEDAEAWQADTIFLGASGITRRGYLVLGSVSTAVAARAHCTVEVVRSAP